MARPAPPAAAGSLNTTPLRPRSGQFGVEIEKILPVGLSCGHPECSLWEGCTHENLYELTVPFTAASHLTNALLGMRNQQRFATTKPIREAAAEAARGANLPRLASAWFFLSARYVPRRNGVELDLGCLDLWFKHFEDGLTTRWTAAQQEAKAVQQEYLLRMESLVKRGKLPGDKASRKAWWEASTPSITSGPDADSAAVLVDDGPRYVYGKTVRPPRIDRTPGAVDRALITIHANPPRDWEDDLDREAS